MWMNMYIFCVELEGKMNGFEKFYKK